MRKLFKLNLWPSEEEKKNKQLYNQQQKGGAFNVPAPPPTGGIVVDGVDNGSGGGAGGERRLFGIRNYLHNFYFLSPSPTVEEIMVGSGGGGGMVGSPSGGQWYLLPPPPSHRMGLYVCRLMSVLGLLLLLGGAAAIIVGYTWPQYSNSHNNIEASLMRIAIDQDEDGNFYLPHKELQDFLRDPMHPIKMTGFCLFAVGASVLALSLLVPTFAQCAGAHSRLAAFASGDNTPNEAPVRVYPTAGGGGGKFRVSPTAGRKISPNSSGPIPAMEEISKVQPTGKKSPSPPAYSPTADDLLGAVRDNSALLSRQ